jgi:hypothetical protein
VSNAGKKTQALGVVNGINQCFASSVRTIGPALGGTVWSWSLLHHLPFPFDFHLVFNLLWFFSMLGFLYTFYVADYLSPPAHSQDETSTLLKCK